VSRRYDAVVVGVGTMGSAALYHLARRGCRVLGLEQFDVAHEHGSMHGETRIIRLAYHEHPAYVPLLLRAYELWRELDASLLHLVGSLDVGREDGPLVSGAVRALREHNLPYELVEPVGVGVPLDHVALLQPDGGYVEAERAVRAHVEAALAAGAELRIGEQVLDWTPEEVRTDAGVYPTARVVLCPGPWPELLQLPGDLLAVEEQLIAWFEWAAPDMPIFIVEEDDGANFYGIQVADRVKVGCMHTADEGLLVEFAQRRLAGAGAVLRTQTCKFTNTPDLQFAIDLHPGAANVVFASACSGHGFKFAPVVGEILADLALDGATRHEIDFLRLGRFGPVRGQTLDVSQTAGDGLPQRERR
jgi:sarcosine oxidase